MGNSDIIIVGKYSGLTDASAPATNDAKEHKHSLKGLPPPNTPDPQVLFRKKKKKNDNYSKFSFTII